MNYCEAHLGKPLVDITYKDVEDFFLTPREENDQVEFKSFEANLDKSVQTMVKALCGFLNSDDGLLVCGAPRQSSSTGNKNNFVGPLHPILTAIEHDQLLSKCLGQITPIAKFCTPTGIR